MPHTMKKSHPAKVKALTAPQHGPEYWEGNRVGYDEGMREAEMFLLSRMIRGCFTADAKSRATIAKTLFEEAAWLAASLPTELQDTMPASLQIATMKESEAERMRAGFLAEQASLPEAKRKQPQPWDRFQAPDVLDRVKLAREMDAWHAHRRAEIAAKEQSA